MWHGNNTARAVRWYAEEKKKKQGIKRKECVRERIRMRGQRGLCQHPTCLTVCSYCGSTGTTRSQKLKSLCACVLTVRRYRACYIQLASSRLWQVHQIFVCGLQKRLPTAKLWLKSCCVSFDTTEMCFSKDKVEPKSILVEICTLIVEIHHGTTSIWRTHGRWQLKGRSTFIHPTYVFVDLHGSMDLREYEHNPVCCVCVCARFLWFAVKKLQTSIKCFHDFFLFQYWKRWLAGKDEKQLSFSNTWEDKWAEGALIHTVIIWKRTLNRSAFIFITNNQEGQAGHAGVTWHPVTAVLCENNAGL